MLNWVLNTALITSLYICWCWSNYAAEVKVKSAEGALLFVLLLIFPFSIRLLNEDFNFFKS